VKLPPPLAPPQRQLRRSQYVMWTRRLEKFTSFFLVLEAANAPHELEPDQNNRPERGSKASSSSEVRMIKSTRSELAHPDYPCTAYLAVSEKQIARTRQQTVIIT